MSASRPSRHCRTWTREDEGRLIVLYREYHSTCKMAVALGRSVTSVELRITRLRVNGRL